MARPVRRRLTVHMLRDRLGIKPPKELTDMVRRQAEIRTKITQALKKGPKTVPEIAEETELDTYTVFWYLMTMYRHGQVEEEGKTDEGYFKYMLKR
jgi:predicted transcriptional regulator